MGQEVAHIIVQNDVCEEVKVQRVSRISYLTAITHDVIGHGLAAIRGH